MAASKKRKTVYSTVQIPTEIHKQLVEYCNRNGLFIGRFVGVLFATYMSGSAHMKL